MRSNQNTGEKVPLVVLRLDSKHQDVVVSPRPFWFSCRKTWLQWIWVTITNQRWRSDSSVAQAEFAAPPSDQLSGQTRRDKWLLIIHIPLPGWQGAQTGWSRCMWKCLITDETHTHTHPVVKGSPAPGNAGVSAKETHAHVRHRYTERGEKEQPFICTHMQFLPLHVEQSQNSSTDYKRATSFFKMRCFFLHLYSPCFHLNRIAAVTVVLQLRRYCFVWDGESDRIGNSYVQVDHGVLYTHFIVPLLLSLQLNLHK